MQAHHIAFGLVLAACVPAGAQLNYLSQTRLVSASTNYGGGDSQQAPDFGPFHGSASATGSLLYGGSASAGQDSTLGPWEVTFSGQTTAEKPTAAGTGRANADSKLMVTFRIDQPILYTTTISLPSSPGSDPTQPALAGEALVLSGDGSTTYPLAGTLAAGEYQLQFSYSAQDYYPMDGAVGNYSVDFVASAAPEPTSISLAALGGVALLACRRRKRVS